MFAMIKHMWVEVADAGSAEAAALLQAYIDEIASTFPSGFDPDASVSAHVEEVSPPHGAFLVVRRDDGRQSDAVRSSCSTRRPPR